MVRMAATFNELRYLWRYPVRLDNTCLCFSGVAIAPVLATACVGTRWAMQ